MRLLELFERSGGTAAVAFGRMNPPTIGHQKVVDAILKQKADAHFLFVSQTHKPTGKNKTRLENPLPFDVKLGFIQQAFPNIDIGDTSVGTAIGILQNLEKQGFENVIFVCGSDRVAAFTELFNKQNGVDYDLKSIKIVSSGARDPDAEGADGMSASKMRAAAIANDFESFKSGLPAGLSGDADEVFSAVRQGLEPWLEDVEEGWKDKVAAAGLAGAMAFGASGANARVTPGDDPNINRLTGKPIAAQQATDTAPAKAEAPKGFSKEYLQAVVDGKHPRPMVSVEKAQELLKNMSEKESVEITELADDDAYYKYIVAKVKTNRPLSTREKEFLKTYTLLNKKTEGIKIPFAGAKVGHKEGPAGQWRNKGPKANKPAKVGDLVGGSAS
jgi:uncharacterized protein (DUF3820 family)